MITCSSLGNVLSTRQPSGLQILRCNRFACSVTLEKDRVKTPEGYMRSCEGCKFNTTKKPELADIFDRAVVINLERRADRLEALREEFKQWPFVQPIIQKAIDGKRVPFPEGFKDNSPFTWGCLQSHRRALEDAINDGCESLIVLEDDTKFVPGFADKCRQFFNDVPDDWEIVFLAGRHHAKPTLIKNGVLKANELQYMGCYGVRGKGLIELYKFWHKWHDTHCDIAAQKWFGTRKTYTPFPFLAGHAGGYSDIGLHDKPPSNFNAGVNWINGGASLLDPDPGYQPFELPYVDQDLLPCAKRGERQGAVNCHCPSAAPVSVHLCEEYGVCTFIPKRNDLVACSQCKKRVISCEQ